MSLQHPSSQGFTPIGTSCPAWSLFVYLVADRAAQQRILRSIRELGRAGLVALGTQRGSEYFVIIDYDTDIDKTFAKVIAPSIDPSAIMTFSGRKTQIRRQP